MSLEYKITAHTSGVKIINLAGKILANDNVDDIQLEIEEQLKKQEKLFVLDISEVSYIDSSGLNFFLRIFTKIRNKAAEVIFCAPSTAVIQLLKISKLDSVFTVCANQEEALNLLIAKEHE